MTETLHRPTPPETLPAPETIAGRLSADMLDRLKTMEQDAIAAEGFRPSEEMTARLSSLETPIAREPAPLKAVTPHNRPERAPRMTPALQEALQKFTIDSRIAPEDAHKAALDQYRTDDRDAYVDHIASLSSSENEASTPDAREFYQELLTSEERRADREALVDAGKLRAQELGSMALETAKNAGLITLGLGVMAYAASEKRTRRATFRVRANLQDRSFARENRKLRALYEKDVAKLDKQTVKSNAKLEKSISKDMGRAKKYDEKFELSMQRKAVREARKEAVIVKIENGARRAGEAYRSTVDGYEKSKALLPIKSGNLVPLP